MNWVKRHYSRKWSFHWARVDNPARDASSLTALIWKHLEIAPGMSVADVGAGFGYFSFQIAKRVGEAGHVLATDASLTTVLRLRAHHRESGLPNVSVRYNPPLWLALPRARFDRVLIVNAFPFVEGQAAKSRLLLWQIAQALRPSGRFVLFADAIHTTDWCPPFGSPLRRNQAEPEEIIDLAKRWLTPIAHERLKAGSLPPGKRPGYLLAFAKA